MLSVDIDTRRNLPGTRPRAIEISQQRFHTHSLPAAATATAQFQPELSSAIDMPVDNAEKRKSREAAARCASAAALLRNQSAEAREPHIGYCSTVSWRASSRCDSDDRGALRVPSDVSAASLWAECSALCRACARCRFVSASLRFRRCWWYAHCDLHTADR